MIVSYRWLMDVAPGLELSPGEIAERLAMRGAPVEQTEELGARFDGLCVARVVEVGEHPNADRLSLCTVDAGEGEVVQVICGAPNVEQGGWYPFAPVGSSLPGGMKIKRARIRGVESHGMLCSERELGLGRDHSGILRLEGDFQEGQALTEALGLDDVRFDVEVTPNRGDLMSHLGIAREVAPQGHAGLRLPGVPGGQAYEVPSVSDREEVSSGGLRLRIEAPDLCPRFLAVVIRGLQVGPSPAWLANRLRAVGSQPINNVVDVTNYAMLEMGHPMHAYDLDRLAGPAIVVRRARSGEMIETLDGVKRTLTADMVAVCDVEEPVGIGGVMGGASSEVDEETVNVLLECALWHPPNIRNTRRALDLSTDASYRFERGVDPAFHERAIRRAAEMIMAVAGGKPDGKMLDVCPGSWSPADVPLRPARVSRLLGVPFDAKGIRGLIEPLGFEVTDEDADRLTVRVPGFRSHDVGREVDLIEEVARTYGYDSFPEALGPFRPGTVPDDPLFRLEDRMRWLLAGRGFFEAHVPAFAPEPEGEVELMNPISSKDSHMRRWLLPGLLRRVGYNFARGNRTVRLFELGTSFRAPAAPGAPPAEATHLAVVLTGRRAPMHWSGDDAESDIWDLKAVADAVVRAVYGDRGSLEPGEPGHPSLSGRGYVAADPDGRTVGWAAAATAVALDPPAWAGPIWALELELPEEPTPTPPILAAPLPEFPGVDRDLALLLAPHLAVQQVQDAIEAAGGSLLRKTRVFDVYRGDEVPQGYRSVALRLRFQSPERTLRDDEVDRATARILRKLKEELGVEPRG